MKRIVYSMALTCAMTMFAAQQNGNGRSFTPDRGSKGTSPAIFYQGDDALPAGAPAGYNAPGNIVLKGDEGILPDLFMDVSFLYYYAKLEGLNLANSASLERSGDSYTTALVSNSQVLEQSCNYKPAFKVGLGSSFDECFVVGEYTWIRQTNNTNSGAASTTPSDAGSVWVAQNWFQQDGVGNSISSEWKLSMDIADLKAGRPFYQGRRALVSPFVGLRSAWIRNAVNVSLETSSLYNPLAVPTLTSSNHSNSWSLGPRAGLDFHAILGEGFRIQGNLATAALYTAYTSVKHSENSLDGDSTFRVSEDGTYSTVRPELELGLGLGWGTYLCGEEYHIDFGADYNFLVFWGQNLIRRMMDEVVAGTGGSSGDLYLHGLNITARFDF